jgi:hypothetical protein
MKPTYLHCDSKKCKHGSKGEIHTARNVHLSLASKKKFLCTEIRKLLRIGLCEP